MKFFLMYSHIYIYFYTFSCFFPCQHSPPIQGLLSVLYSVLVYLLKRFPRRHCTNCTTVNSNFMVCWRWYKSIIVILDYILGVIPKSLVSLTNFIRIYGKFKPKNTFILNKHPHCRMWKATRDCCSHPNNKKKPDIYKILTFLKFAVAWQPCELNSKVQHTPPRADRRHSFHSWQSMGEMSCCNVRK